MKEDESLNIKLVNDFIFYCSNYRATKIINILKHRIISTNMPNKLRFYEYLRFMINCMRESSTGMITHEWGKIKWMNKVHNCVRFYDETHIYPRLTIIIEVESKKLHLETIPF